MIADLPLISIVDDDSRVRAALCQLVTSFGYTACAFASAEEFFQSSEKRNTSCLIVDVQLPGINGLDLQARLSQERPILPVILMTAFPDANARDLALAHGAICFLHKPFDGKVLKKWLEKALARSSLPD
jgi:FixJ family two-component response regulator